jgi:osmotically-inducible protein OsmY
MDGLFASGVRGSTNGGTTMSDRQLRQEILDVFQWDPRIGATHVNVAVQNGVVTLTGVGTNDERIATEEAVRHVSGVRELLQKIEVWPVFADKPSLGKSNSELATD